MAISDLILLLETQIRKVSTGHLQFDLLITSRVPALRRSHSTWRPLILLSHKNGLAPNGNSTQCTRCLIRRYKPQAQTPPHSCATTPHPYGCHCPPVTMYLPSSSLTKRSPVLERYVRAVLTAVQATGTIVTVANWSEPITIQRW